MQDNTARDTADMLDEDQVEEMNNLCADELVQVKPFVSNDLKDLLSDTQILLSAARLNEGPVHILVPTGMDNNIARMRETFEEIGVDYRIYFAHKVCKSTAMVRQARKNNIGLDVASKPELAHALENGFTGDTIVCTGAKNREFLRLALMQGCLVACDSEDEIEKIAELLFEHPELEGAELLLRISDMTSKDRTARRLSSRFGIPQENIPLILEWLGTVPNIKLRGFHFHNDERNRDTRAGFVDNALSIMEQAVEAGFSPDIIDIGGSLRAQRVDDRMSWSNFVDQVAQGLLNQRDTGTWRGFGLGLGISSKGQSIEGRERLQGKYASDEDFSEVLPSILHNDSFRGRPLSAIINEYMFTVAVEPGFALLQQCGVTLFRVVGVKATANGDALIMVDGNIYNLSQERTEILYDPMLIPQEKEEGAEKFAGYIIGNMCLEEDVLTKRRIAFDQMPVEGDLICFPNTAAYNMDFEDTNPHMHPTGRKLVAVKDGENWTIMSEDVYSPYGNKE